MLLVMYTIYILYASRFKLKGNHLDKKWLPFNLYGSGYKESVSHLQLGFEHGAQNIIVIRLGSILLRSTSLFSPSCPILETPTTVVY